VKCRDKLNIPLFLLALACSLSLLEAKIVAIERGNFTVAVTDDAVLLTKESCPDAADNVLFPRLRGSDFYLDSVTWLDAQKARNLDDVLRQHAERPGFKALLKEAPIISQQPFKSASGVQGIRYIQQRTYEDGHKIELYRFIFRNSQQTVICLGIMGSTKTADRIYSSVTLSKP
jgi:hypothetical protein